MNTALHACFGEVCLDNAWSSHCVQARSRACWFQLSAGLWGLRLGFKVEGKEEGLGFKVEGKEEGLGFKVEGKEEGLGFKVEGKEMEKRMDNEITGII